MMLVKQFVELGAVSLGKLSSFRDVAIGDLQQLG